MKTGSKRHLFRPPSETEAIQLYQSGMTPASIERTLVGGAGLDYLAKKWQMTAARAAGIAVYYGIWTPDQADAKLREVYA